jgi:putative ABC transport system permease protein
MKLLPLAWKNISRNRLRSWTVLLCALVLSAFSLFTTLLLRGAATGLELSVERLGADIVVVPQGTRTEMEGALLTAIPDSSWMPAETVAKLAAIPGVKAVSPQIYLATVAGPPSCPASEVHLIAFDPRSDLTVQPWLEKQLPAGLKAGEAIGGDCISPQGKRLDKVGVYAVREAPVIFRNLVAMLYGGNPVPFSPQRTYLQILNLGDGAALLIRNSLAYRGKGAFFLKEYLAQKHSPEEAP